MQVKISKLAFKKERKKNYITLQQVKKKNIVGEMSINLTGDKMRDKKSDDQSNPGTSIITIN